MTTSEQVQAFREKWQRSQLNEKAVAQEHFTDLCRLLGVPTPNEADPTGEFYRFEKPLTKVGGGAGYADVWYRGRFVWEYKSPGRSLETAYQQLQLYKENLDNPPILIVCDIKRYEVHIVYTGYRTRVEMFTNDDLQNASIRELLTLVFTDPERLRPNGKTSTVTEKAAEQFALLASALEARGYRTDQISPFFMKVLFALFAEDMRILPGKLLSSYIDESIADPDDFPSRLLALFQVMRNGGYFGHDKVPCFNGWLYNANDIIPLEEAELRILRTAATLDWKDIEPSIFGTLFERSIDPTKRSQLGLHYTSSTDIALIVEPVLMYPLRREWQAVQEHVATLLPEWDTIRSHYDQTVQTVLSNHNTADNFLHITEMTELESHPTKHEYKRFKHRLEGIFMDFIDRLGRVRVLDPACGSGNFLYVALHQMKELEKEVIVYATGLGIDPPDMVVKPEQFFGIEKNEFAAELAQVVLWIGYIQWLRANGVGKLREPILRTVETIHCQDAIVAVDENGTLYEPPWVEADVVIGNPPFLGGKKLRTVLGNERVDQLFTLYKDRVPHEADMVCYWFERARAYVEQGFIKRVGLLATQAIRAGASRKVLERIKTSGDIFMGWSNRPWLLEGAAVRIAMVGFDNGSEQHRVLDGKEVATIYANLTTDIDLTQVQRLEENLNLSFMGDIKVGQFDIDDTTAQAMLQATNNPHGRPNSDVIRPWVNAMDIVRRPRTMWIIDFGVDMSEEDAAQYVMPFTYVQQHVKPTRKDNRMEKRATKWWIHGDAAPRIRTALEPLKRFIVTPGVAKHRIFVWLTHPILPDHRLTVFARDDDYFFGILHSRVHEVWALATSSRHGTGGEGGRPTYNNTTCFETFPLPWAPGREPMDDPRVQAIAAAAHDLVCQREAWLNPPNMGEKALKQRTLTNLYNERPDWLTLAHTTLDNAVFAAYGWEQDLSDMAILERLLELNLSRSK